MKPREMHLSAAETFIVCFIILLFKRASADYFFHLCLNTTTNFTAGSPYETNRNQLLVSLTANAFATGFYNDTAGQNPNRVYGRALCRGDLSPNNCTSCLTNARNQILQRCPFSKDAIIWFDECQIVHYSRLFVFNTSTVIRTGGLNDVNVSDPTAFNGVWGPFLANLVTKAASDSSLFYAADSINSTNQPTIYGLVQCCRDLSRVECNECLGNGLADISRYGYAQGVRFLCDSCTIRYENYTFFGAPAVSPSNSPAGGTKGFLNFLETVELMGGKFLNLIVLRFKQEAVYFPANTGKTSKRPNATIVSVGAVLVGALVGFVVCYLWRKKLRKANIKVKHEAFLQCLGPATGTALTGKDGKSQDLPLIDLATVQASTDNFSDSNWLGKGGFGPVYKGTLPDGKEIAVKRLSRSSGQGLEEFKNEIISIAKLQHKNLVRLFGCCLEKEEKLLIYEYMPNKSLDFFLFDPIKRIDLDWRRRFDIIAGIARGLLYLHEDSRLKVIHRDLKASNVLLDHDMNPKISDFGLARIFGGNQDEASTKRVVGTYGYMAPEYAMEGSFSVKSDVFSFGVLVLEIVSGKRNTGFYLSEHAQSLLAYAWKLWSEERSIELMDHLLGDTCPISEVLRYIQIGLLCVQEDPAVRPPMSKVVLMLGTESLTLPRPMEPAFSIRRTITDSSAYSANEVTISKMDPR